jgi:cold shock CspA family protein
MPNSSGVLSPGGKPKPPPQRRSGGRRQLTAIIVAAVAATFLVGWLGYCLHAWTHPDKSVTVLRTLTGTVTIVNSDNNAGCVKPDGGGKPLCTTFANLGPALHAGQNVHAAYELVHSGGGESYKTLLIYPFDKG